jgi:hypothetical protein
MCGVVHWWRLFHTPGIPDKCLIDQLCRDAVCSGAGQIRLQFSPSPLRADDAVQGDGGQTAEEEPFICSTVLKERPNFLYSAPTSTESALRLLSAPSVCLVKQLKCLCIIFTKFAAKFHTYAFFKLFYCHFVTNPTTILCTCSFQRM